MSFSAFADGSDETALDGYHVDCVPYDESFQNVLTSSDGGSQFFSSSENKTYLKSSAVQVAESESESLFHAKSIVDMIPRNAWKSNNDTYKVSFPVDNGYTGVAYSWTSESKPNKVYHQSVGLSSFTLKANRKYRFTFTISCPMRSKGTFDFFLADRENPSAPVVQLFHNVASPNGGGNLWVGSREITIEYVCPNNISTLIPEVKADIYGLDFVCYINDFTITDITSEDLDNSLGKLGDRIKGFFDNLVESIKGFFIPKEGFFDDVKSRFDKLLSDHLGFLYEAPSMVGSIFGVIKDWNPPEHPTITLPAFDFKIGDDHIHLWDEQVYTFDFLSNQPWSTLYAFYKTSVFVLLSVAMINLAIKKYHSIVGGGDSDDN